MPRRAIVNYATGSYVRGQERLRCSIRQHCVEYLPVLTLTEHYFAGPPYSFKAWALRCAVTQGFEQIIWLDASIMAVADIAPAWDRLERNDGVLLMRNGFSNYEWTADSAYADLFPSAPNIAVARDCNRTIEHVVGGMIGVDVRTPKGMTFADSFLDLARSDAFYGPWINSNKPGAPPPDGHRCAPCGPPDVSGHRHDQTAASVLAWRLHVPLVNPPEILAYAMPGETIDPRTVLLVDGSY